MNLLRVLSRSIAAGIAGAGLMTMTVRAIGGPRNTGRDAAFGLDEACDEALDPRKIVDAIPAPVGYCGVDRRLRYVNRSFAEVTGFTREELIGRKLDADVISDYTATVDASIRAAVAGTTQRFEHKGRWPGQTSVHEVHYIPHRSSDGVVVGFYIMGFDISALKRSEDQLRRANAALAAARDQAEAAISAKSMFFANMNHEMRTPMHAILGMTQLMARGSNDPLQVDRLTKLMSAAEHLLHVIDDSLDLSALDAGKFRLEPVRFARDELVSGAFRMVAEPARRKGLELFVETDTLPPRMLGDAIRLSQMLINLLSNAVKFTDAGWVRLRTLRLGDPSDPHMLVRFEVSDTGVGIPPDHHRRLFAPYERAVDAADMGRAGTGLGLALTRQLARAMGGDTGFESEPGLGSTFWFTAELQALSDVKEERSDLLHGLAVLIIHDLAESRAAIAEDARRLGLRATTFGSCDEAVGWLVGRRGVSRVDALLINRVVGGVDGCEIRGRIRTLLRESMPRSILVTNDDDAETSARAAEAGFDLVVSKPITTTTLEVALTSILRLGGPREFHTPPSFSRASELEARLRREYQGRRVLLAEDNAVNREIAGEMLRMAGLVVEYATDGLEALDLARRATHDLLLLDLGMPGLGGLEVAKALRREGAVVPIIAMTARAFTTDRAACLAAGMNDHVAKPVALDVLYEAVLRWLPPSNVAAPREAPVRVRAVASQVIERLSEVNGFDLDAGLQAVGGDIATLLLAIDDFIGEYANGFPLPEAEDEVVLTDACHSLSGAAATVGASTIARQSRDLERHLNSSGLDGDAATEVHKLSQDLKSLSARLRDALASR